MAEQKATTAAKSASTPGSRSKARSSDGFTAEEKAAMKERAREAKAQARGQASREKGEADVQARIAEMPEADRAMAERIHAIVAATAPDLAPRTWYGMPAYANAAGKVICFFQSADKFKVRYATLGFNEEANLDHGHMWPTSFALKQVTAAEEKQIAALIKKALR
ncbi:MAG: DUF1801 domain-containing protein [Dehalococcoidia bacterium]|nr:DUF1801 domain-containing protein [Dehalococcoidia bacterium]